MALLVLLGSFQVHTIHSTKMSHGHAHAHQHGPVIGKAAPAFKATAVVNGDFKEVSSTDYKGKWLVLFFYPLGKYRNCLCLFRFLMMLFRRFYLRVPHRDHCLQRSRCRVPRHWC